MDTAVAIDGYHFTTQHALLCLLPPRTLPSVCRSLSSNPVFPGFFCLSCSLRPSPPLGHSPSVAVCPTTAPALATSAARGCSLGCLLSSRNHASACLTCPVGFACNSTACNSTASILMPARQFSILPGLPHWVLCRCRWFSDCLQELHGHLRCWPVS